MEEGRFDILVLCTLLLFNTDISTNISGALHMSGRAAIIFVEIMIEYLKGT
jgi:hypothetical protein